MVDKNPKHRTPSGDDQLAAVAYSATGHPSIKQLMAEQGTGPITDVSVLHGHFWPQEESIEEFLAALHEWRGHQRTDPGPCTKRAEVTVAARAAGRRIECADAWIAATALLYGAPLVTHNGNDYLGVPDLKLISHGT